MKPISALMHLLAICALVQPLRAGAADEDVTDGQARPSTTQPARPAPWEHRKRGWHFFDDPAPEPAASAPAAAPRPAPRPAPAKPASSAPATPVELAQFKVMQQRLEDLRQIAVVSPTEANVRAYMQYEAAMVRQASRFSEVAQLVAWSTPELDMTLQGRPVNARAIEVFDREQSQSRGRSLSALANTHVLFFFFRSDCPYCHAFAPTLQAFQASHGIQVVPISVDGRGLPGYPSFRTDNGIGRTLQVTQVPAVFLANPYDGKIVPIGFGVLSESQLVERIVTVTQASAGQTASSFRPLNSPSAGAP